MLKVAAILPAAGRGLRLGGQPKQFRLLGGLPLLVQTALVFDRHPEIDQVIIAAPVGEVESVREIFMDAPMGRQPLVVEGGDARSASVARAVMAAVREVDVILIHDAVRPFVRRPLISAVIKAAADQGAASLAIPVSDTLRRGEEGQLTELVERENTYRVQTPQAFRRDLLVQAFARAEGSGMGATDEASIVLDAGHPVKLVPGSVYNIKITSPEDWELAEILWKQWDDPSDR